MLTTSGWVRAGARPLPRGARQGPGAGGRSRERSLLHRGVSGLYAVEVRAAEPDVGGDGAGDAQLVQRAGVLAFCGVPVPGDEQVQRRLQSPLALSAALPGTFGPLVEFGALGGDLPGGACRVGAGVAGGAVVAHAVHPSPPGLVRTPRPGPGSGSV